jgi:hypothetical protein
MQFSGERASNRGYPIAAIDIKGAATGNGKRHYFLS